MAEAKEEVKHTVLAKFKNGLPADRIEDLINGYANLLSLFPSVKSFHWGKNVSVENLHQGYTHVFESIFESREGAAEYASHPAHLEFAKEFLLDVDNIIVIDYIPTAIATPAGGSSV